ncbi:SDR family oxidoreductase [Georgenia sp. 10Sc9-8]|uniref:SDR family oxidoreductase n=1 Tax=Georgenia halotolerans TaxID=3028317 RepID=A0ABT5TZS5_9MICO|nr:SDR family oxidoreductase [Georgenia halotolerans]
MRAVIAGGHGKIALALERLLAERGDEVVGLIRNPDHADELEKLGAEPAIFDLENDTAEELAKILDGADAVVFAAGAGPGSGIARKRTVDYGGAVLLADAAERAGVRRYVMVSAIGVDRGSEHIEDETFAAYVDAKREADADVMSRDLDWTILRPGGLTDDPGTGLVTMGDDVGMGQVPREDVAAVIAAVLDEPESAGVVAELISGDTAIVDAVEGLWA